MNTQVNCPGCGFRARLPDALAGVKSVVCPQCKTAVPVESRGADALPPIWVDGSASDRAPAPARPAPPEPEPYTGEYMKDEAERFAQYVAARLAELHKKRMQLAEAECKFEAQALDQKQELHRVRAATAADAERLKEREAAVAAKEAALTAREAEVAARESRTSRAEVRATETDRRTAELRAAIDQLEARRAALAEERVALDRRAAELDRAELAQHRRAAELDEFDERLRLEYEEFEREQSARGRAG